MKGLSAELEVLRAAIGAKVGSEFELTPSTTCWLVVLVGLVGVTGLSADSTEVLLRTVLILGDA